MPECGGQRTLQDTSLGCCLASTIVRLAEKPLHQGIDDHVSRTGIESNYFVYSRCGRNQRQISNASDILQHTSAFLICELHIIEERHQRSTLTTGYHICRTEVADDRH